MGDGFSELNARFEEAGVDRFPEQPQPGHAVTQCIREHGARALAVLGDSSAAGQVVATATIARDDGSCQNGTVTSGRIGWPGSSPPPS